MYGLLAGIIVSMGVGGYLYYNDTQTELVELRDLNSAFKLKFEQQEETINKLEEDFQLQTESLNELQSRSQEIQAEMNRYLDIFKRHNLTKLAAAKPGLIETRVNKGTKDVFDSIENDSRGIDALDNGLQLDTQTTSGSKDTNEISTEKDSTADISKSN